MIDPKLDQLKLKYQSVLNLMDTLKVQLKNLHVHEGKLVIRGEAKTKDDVNRYGTRSSWSKRTTSRT